MAGNKVLMVDADAASRNFVAAALHKEGLIILQAASGKEGLIAAWRDRPELVIVDPVMADLKGEDLAVRLRSDARTAQIPLIALSSDPAEARVRSCLEAGFNKYLVKTAQTMPALVEAIGILLGTSGLASKNGGLLIVFLSAKGGTGTSSLCANIAMNIATNEPGARVVVADLVLPIGSIAGIVGYEGEQDLVMVAEMLSSETPPEFYRTGLTQMANWRFHLLAGSPAPDPESGNELKVARIEEIVTALKSTYDYVLLDLGRSLSRISLPLIEHADLIALVVSTDLSTVDLTKTVLDYLRAKGVQDASIYAILNRAVGLGGLTKAEAEKIIGLEIKTAMPYLAENFALANNQHLPIALKYPNETAAIVLREAAQQMAGLARNLRAG